MDQVIFKNYVQDKKAAINYINLNKKIIVRYYIRITYNSLKKSEII
jgi:hypothetical protein